MKNNVFEILVKSGAFLEGHFLLTSGRHSNQYIEKFRLMESPEHLNKICKMMAFEFEKYKVDIVMGAAIGGILLSSGVAKYFNKKSIFTERVSGKMKLRRGFEIKKHENVLIVEDIVTTGGSIFELVDVVEEYSGNIIGISSIVHRSSDKIDFGYRYKPLLTHHVDSWTEDDIPDWLKKIPISVHGRSGK
ncbi:MAG: orotate phosphoribosyltransferase [Candidatus Marinimicrobia bacterium]|nr:orotate phosphoribosyltransferase [Candidatus Neomarinimicrobiota bacterium]|tara:strand:- start:5524 stop:6093 length:570 start_codon:yes stop_codon:yes gene_type:complete